MSKIALVTGGTRGIGAGISNELKKKGYIVAANFYSATEKAEKFSVQNGIPVFSWNVADYDDCARGIEMVHQKLGGDIEILINNAGITCDAMFHKMTADIWGKVIATNLNSVFNMCNLLVPKMRENNFGRIINISSVNAFKGQIGQVNYSAAKSGIIGFTKSLALEVVTKGITVNAIAPGYVATDMTDAIRADIKEKIIQGIPMRRFAEIDEIANAVSFLLDIKSSFITGTTLHINGAQYL